MEIKLYLKQTFKTNTDDFYCIDTRNRECVADYSILVNGTEVYEFRVEGRESELERAAEMRIEELFANLFKVAEKLSLK